MELKERYPKNWIKEGLEVAHYDNPKKKLFVSKIVKEKILIRGELKNRLKCIKCYWHEEINNGEKSMIYSDFFSTHLVPYEVGIEGKELIDKFRNRFADDY